ncbi:MAG TPA: hypothetical protein V6D08_03860 [Candidatus Obscuribacterales bacterium]
MRICPARHILKAVLPALMVLLAQPVPAQELIGPVNLLKTMPTPFGPPPQTGAGATGEHAGAEVRPISIASGGGAPHGPRRLADRLLAPRLYMPGRMVLGKPAEFTVKGRPGCHVALAMADKNSGAKPIYGHRLRLGPDRKVVAVGTIPESGVLSLAVDTPIQGDLIGQHWFFEAAIWSRSDFSDLELAVPVTSEGQEETENGVLVSAENEQKRGLKFVADPAVPLQQRPGSVVTPLDSGRL